MGFMIVAHPFVRVIAVWRCAVHRPAALHIWHIRSDFQVASLVTDVSSVWLITFKTSTSAPLAVWFRYLFEYDCISSYISGFGVC
jgi:hypothetical protein